MVADDICLKIKNLRTIKKLTIQDLGKKTNLSVGYLSRIENSKNPPPIPTLIKIAYALNVHVSYFFEDSDEENGRLTIVKNQKRKELIGDYTSFGYRYEAIIKNRSEPRVKPLVITLPVVADADSIPYNSHDGEEIIYVLGGRLFFFYGDDRHLVEEGDCLHFDSAIPHKVISTSETDAAKILSFLML